MSTRYVKLVFLFYLDVNIRSNIHPSRTLISFTFPLALGGMTAGLFNGQALSPPSKTVNVFDLTSKHGLEPEGAAVSSTKERAIFLTLYVILTMVVLTAVLLLLGEAFGLQWTLCDRATNKTTPVGTWTWPWSAEFFRGRWNSLSLKEKRNEILRASMGEVDLYDFIDLPKESNSMEVN